jgi:chromosome segregation ATPase
MFLLLLKVVGCSFSSAKNPLPEAKAQFKKSQSKTAKAIDAPAQIKKDRLNLAQAKAELKLAQQKVKLSELKMELSILEMKLADCHQEIAETMVRKAYIFQKCQRLEADLKAGRVNKAEKIDKLKALKTKSLDFESENIKTQATIAKLDLEIQELKQKVDLYTKRSALTATTR